MRSVLKDCRVQTQNTAESYFSEKSARAYWKHKQNNGEIFDSFI